MNLSHNEIVREFWRSYNLAKNKEIYKEVLIQAKESTLKLLLHLKGEQFLCFNDESPLLAIISEVYRECPEAVKELAATDTFFNKALEILYTYDEEKMNLLRDTFLKAKDY